MKAIFSIAVVLIALQGFGQSHAEADVLKCTGKFFAGDKTVGS
ncbi:hypothetical protein [Segetibacter koreensis]|nr:hypothetical protein [Segetibacter koreensis]